MLKTLLTYTQNEIAEELANIPGIQSIAGNLLLYTGPEIKPLICVHTDTVSKVPPLLTEIIEYKGILSLDKNSTSTCLGGDDRAGIYIALQLINSKFKNKYNYAFFRDEEAGAQGSQAFSMTQEFFELEETTSCFIGIDRRSTKGELEIAQYDYDSDELLDILDEVLPEYVFSAGSFTDCSVLSEQSGTLIPCFNITAGYEFEHSPREIIHLEVVKKVINTLKDLVLPARKFEYTPIYANAWKSAYTNEVLCDVCGEHEKLFMLSDGSYVCSMCKKYTCEV